MQPLGLAAQGLQVLPSPGLDPAAMAIIRQGLAAGPMGRLQLPLRDRQGGSAKPCSTAKGRFPAKMAEKCQVFAKRVLGGLVLPATPSCLSFAPLLPLSPALLVGFAPEGRNKQDP